MVIARNHPHGLKQKEIQGGVRVKQRHHLITPPPRTAAFLVVAHLAVLLLRKGMVVRIKEKLDRTLIACFFHLPSITEQQSPAFDRTSSGWRFSAKMAIA
jgi:hypothetical protein